MMIQKPFLPLNECIIQSYKRRNNDTSAKNNGILSCRSRIIRILSISGKCGHAKLLFPVCETRHIIFIRIFTTPSFSITHGCFVLCLNLIVIIIIKIYCYPLFALSTNTRDDSEPTGGAFVKNTPKKFSCKMNIEGKSELPTLFRTGMKWECRTMRCRWMTDEDMGEDGDVIATGSRGPGVGSSGFGRVGIWRGLSLGAA
jgi:hypothetical protein